MSKIKHVVVRHARRVECLGLVDHLTLCPLALDLVELLLGLGHAERFGRQRVHRRATPAVRGTPPAACGGAIVEGGVVRRVGGQHLLDALRQKRRVERVAIVRVEHVGSDLVAQQRGKPLQQAHLRRKVPHLEVDGGLSGALVGRGGGAVVLRRQRARSRVQEEPARRRRVSRGDERGGYHSDAAHGVVGLEGVGKGVVACGIWRAR